MTDTNSVAFILPLIFGIIIFIAIVSGLYWYYRDETPRAATYASDYKDVGPGNVLFPDPAASGIKRKKHKKHKKHKK